MQSTGKKVVVFILLALTTFSGKHRSLTSPIWRTSPTLHGANSTIRLLMTHHGGGGKLPWINGVIETFLLLVKLEEVHIKILLQTCYITIHRDQFLKAMHCGGHEDCGVKRGLQIRFFLYFALNMSDFNRISLQITSKYERMQVLDF